MKRKIFVVMIASALLLQGLTATAMAATQLNDVAGEFICNCGCNQMLTECQMPCGKKLRGAIQDKINQGLNKDQIVRYMKANFGEALLAAPEKSGFNWVAWITPFAVVIIAGVAIEFAIRKWARRGREDDDGDGGDDKAAPPVDKKYNDRVNEELKEFGW